MFVNVVSLRSRRGAISVDLVESTTALDSPGTGNIVFATLVDDPASVGDVVDAYLGEIMLEAANSDALVDTGLAYDATMDEAATAAEASDAALGGTTRSAMVMGVFVNADTSREAQLDLVMVNL
jgi:hypothetical protein